MKYNIKKIQNVFLLICLPISIFSAFGLPPLDIKTVNSQAKFTPEALSTLQTALESLYNLADKDYAPAQELLWLLVYNPEEAKNFLEKYDERKFQVYLPPQGHSRTFWQRIRSIWRRDTPPVFKKPDPSLTGPYLLSAMSELRYFFEEMESLNPQYDWIESIKYAVSKTLVVKFSSQYSQQEMSNGKIIHSLSQKLQNYSSPEISKKCKQTFSADFKPIK